MLTETQSRVQSAFILAIIANSILDVIGLSFSYVRSFITGSWSPMTMFIVGSLVFGAPIVLSAIALSYLKNIQSYEIHGKFRAYYIIARALSLVTLIITSIVAFILLIAFIVLAPSL